MAENDLEVPKEFRYFAKQFLEATDFASYYDKGRNIKVTQLG